MHTGGRGRSTELRVETVGDVSKKVGIHEREHLSSSLTWDKQNRGIKGHLLIRLLYGRSHFTTCISLQSGFSSFEQFSVWSLLETQEVRDGNLFLPVRFSQTQQPVVLKGVQTGDLWDLPLSLGFWNTGEWFQSCDGERLAKTVIA